MSQPFVLSGRYEIGSLIGRGGMADVYEAQDNRLGRRVAVKLLRPDMARDPQFRARFEREAQAVAGLNHVAIVAVYDTGEEPPHPLEPQSVAVPYIVMEYVDGHTLRARLKAAQLDQDQAIEATLGVLDALEYSHRAGIVHRDIKPANVMLTENGQVKVMDFGIARAIADSAATMTQTQAVVGTAQYLSPEQAQGEPVDARSDIYSTGCLLYELLTGRPPFTGDSPVSLAYQHVQALVPPARDFNPDVSDALQSVLDRALQKDPSNRFQDAAAFRRALRQARAGITHLPEHPLDQLATAAIVMHGTGAESATPRPPQTSPQLPPKEDSGGPTRLGDTGQLTHPVRHEQPLVNLRSGDLAQKPGRGRRTAWITVLILATLMVLGGAALWVYNTMRQTDTVVMVTIPNVVNLKENDAILKLSQAGLTPSPRAKSSDTVDADHVIGTTPIGESQVEQGATVTVDVSSGPSSATVPESVIGATEAAARDILDRAGLVPAAKTKFEDSSTVLAGRVISVSPKPKESVAVGSEVEITVSTGKVTVPEVRDKDIADATEELEALGLAVVVSERENSEVDAGTVTAQSADAESSVDQGAEITLTVAKKPDEPSPEPTADPTPSQNPTSTPQPSSPPTAAPSPSTSAQRR